LAKQLQVTLVSEKVARLADDCRAISAYAVTAAAQNWQLLVGN
jgi:hypothetical protein